MKIFLKSLLFFALIVISSLNLYAQAPDSLLKSNQLKLGLKLLGPSLTYERKLSQNYTLYTEVSVEYALYGETSVQYTQNGLGSYDVTFSEKKSHVFLPQITAEARRYYHFAKRQEKKKNTSNNSANFFSVGASFSNTPLFKPENMDAGKVFIVAGKWGIQRVVGKKFSLEFDLGAGGLYWTENKKWYPTPVGNFKFGYVIK